MIPQTKSEAISLGLTKYLGSPCKHGHHEGRMIWSGSCSVCLKEASRLTSEKKRLSNPDLTRRRVRESNAKVRDKRRIYCRAWGKDNTSRKVADNAKRRSAKLKSTLGDYSEEIRTIYQMAHQKSGDQTKYVVDHIYSLRGENSCGLHVPWNLQIITDLENARKSNKSPEEFYGLSSFDLWKVLPT